MGAIYKEKRQINSYECTYNGTVSPAAVLNYFQETAQQQNHHLGIGSDYLDQRHMAWFIVKYHIKINQWPSYGETVFCQTEAKCLHSFIAQRSFVLTDAHDKILIDAMTEWFLVDTEKNEMLHLENYDQLDRYECKNEKMVFRLKRFPKIKAYESSKQFQVRYLDIDFNKHVNHVKYLEWAIESIPPEIAKKGVILEDIKIIFKKQTFYGEIITVKRAALDHHLWQMDIYNEKDELLCQVQMRLSTKK